MKYWLKERMNPQTGVYYVPMGQLPAKEARRYERGTLYGMNFMHSFNTRKEYDARVQELKDSGEKVR